MDTVDNHLRKNKDITALHKPYFTYEAPVIIARRDETASKSDPELNKTYEFERTSSGYLKTCSEKNRGPLRSLRHAAAGIKRKTEGGAPRRSLSSAPP